MEGIFDASKMLGILILILTNFNNLYIGVNSLEIGLSILELIIIFYYFEIFPTNVTRVVSMTFE